ncbi:hypothetical protein CPC08DRAFT_231408 [Agrocybe pediades]|nr:hypothetical protein CPC08DRAFT_231408 [Agrocybe pediades]
MEGRSHTCFGRDYCTFHHICQQPTSENEELNISSSEIRKKKMPGRRTLVDTNSSLLLYSASTSLFASPNKWNPKYTHVDVNPQVGVREWNSYWLKHTPKVDVMVISKAPISAPSWTYDSSSAGNWTYTRRLCKDYSYIGSKCDLDLEYRIVNAAFHATVGQFLPRLLTTLVHLSRNSASDKPTLIWHGSWYIPPVCARNAMPKSATLVPDKWSDHNGKESVDPWTLYYNAQVYIHHGILTRVLPYFNTTYIPLAYPSVRSGKKEIRQAPPNIQFSPSGKRKDCIRNVDFSTGSVPSVFLDKLLTAMARVTEDEHLSM